VGCLARLAGLAGTIGSFFICSLRSELEMGVNDSVNCFAEDDLVDLDAGRNCWCNAVRPNPLDASWWPRALVTY
jgi:hypothetical protein